MVNIRNSHVMYNHNGDDIYFKSTADMVFKLLGSGTVQVADSLDWEFAVNFDIQHEVAYIHITKFTILEKPGKSNLLINNIGMD